MVLTIIILTSDEEREESDEEEDFLLIVPDDSLGSSISKSHPCGTDTATSGLCVRV